MRIAKKSLSRPLLPNELINPLAAVMLASTLQRFEFRSFNRAILFLAVFSGALATFAPSNLYAKDKYPALRPGMHHTEVIEVWGQPEHKLEYESKHEERWVYSGADVLFREGRLASYQIESQELSASAAPAPEEDENSTTLDDIESFSESQSDDMGELLSEIMDELPSENESEKTKKSRKPTLPLRRSPFGRN